MPYRLTDPLPDYKLEPPDEPEWCDDCDEALKDCAHSESDPDAAWENARDMRMEMND